MKRFSRVERYGGIGHIRTKSVGFWSEVVIAISAMTKSSSRILKSSRNIVRVDYAEIHVGFDTTRSISINEMVRARSYLWCDVGDIFLYGSGSRLPNGGQRSVLRNS